VDQLAFRSDSDANCCENWNRHIRFGGECEIPLAFSFCPCCRPIGVLVDVPASERPEKLGD